MPIRQLSDLMIRQIAAGEVIERPASALKELLENALDAGARRIEVHLEQAGKKLLQVCDDGHGMAAAELPLAIAKHATSKLAADDLSDIRSYGFRGEALASIAAVAKLKISSRTAESDAAFEIYTEGGHVSEVSPTSGAMGTTITVQDLFYATPARLKFLRSDRAEMAAIMEHIRDIALCAPHVTFRLFDGGKMKINFTVSAQDHDPESVAFLLPRIAEIFDQNFAEQAYHVENTRAPYRVSGLVGPPNFHRGKPNRQFLIVNGRVIRDHTLAGAVRSGFGDTVPKGSYPVFALFIRCDPEWVDVNVHPAKTEVRFREPALLRSLLHNTVKALLETDGSLTAPTPVSGFQTSPYHEVSRPSGASMRLSENLQQPSLGQDWQPQAYEESPIAPEPALDEFPLGAAKAHLLGNYIVAENAQGLVLIDQHAAHERIVYEKLKKAYHDPENLAVQPLLVPEVLRIDPEDIPRLQEASPVLEGMGLSFEVFGNDAVVLGSVPALLAECDKTKLLEDILAGIAVGCEEEGLRARSDALLSRIACHGSVRSGRRLKREEMNALLRQIETTPNGGYCNHGRPTQIFLSEQEIEKLFKRRN